MLLSVAQCSTTKKNTADPTADTGNASALVCWSEITKEERSRLNLPDTFTVAFSLWKLDTSACRKGLDEFSKKPGQKHVLSMPYPEKSLKIFQVILQPDSVLERENEVCFTGSPTDRANENGLFCMTGSVFYGVIEAGSVNIVTALLPGNSNGIYLCCYKKSTRNTNR
jgi:hypothetical protein